MNRRTEITIETSRLLLISRRKVSALAWCSNCGDQVEMVTADEAARLSRVSQRTIYRRVEAGKLHFLETGEGLLLVCSVSLLS